VFADPLWDDGRAEISVYTGTTRQYDQVRPTGLRLIVVKEDLLAGTLVKSDLGPLPGRTLAAIKLNAIADFVTGTYAYHEMATVMLDRASAEVLKETVSHTEGCGITFVRVGPKAGRLVHEAHSYWEGEADREVEVRWPGAPRLWRDALPLTLRNWCEAAQPFERVVWLLPGQVAGRSPIEATRPVRATIRMAGTTPLAVPAGRYTARRFSVVTPAGVDELWFDAEAPHVLLRIDTSAGRHLELARTRRLDYWNHRANGDERLLE
jgi:hypothetical protein